MDNKINIRKIWQEIFKVSIIKCQNRSESTKNSKKKFKIEASEVSISSGGDSNSLIDEEKTHEIHTS